jgi:hypothetical protein
MSANINTNYNINPDITLILGKLMPVLTEKERKILTEYMEETNPLDLFAMMKTACGLPNEGDAKIQITDEIKKLYLTDRNKFNLRSFDVNWTRELLIAFAKASVKLEGMASELVPKYPHNIASVFKQFSIICNNLLRANFISNNAATIQFALGFQSIRNSVQNFYLDHKKVIECFCDHGVDPLLFFCISR